MSRCKIHNKNTSTYNTQYLVKAFDTSNHTLIVYVMVKYGATPRLLSAMKPIYDRIIDNIIIGKDDTSIDFKLGVKIGYSMAPVI